MKLKQIIAASLISAGVLAPSLSQAQSIVGAGTAMTVWGAGLVTIIATQKKSTTGT